MSPLKWLFGYMKKYIGWMILVVLISFIQVGFVFGQPILLGSFVDVVIIDGNTEVLGFYAILLIAMLGAKELFTYIKQIFTEKISQGVVLDLRNKLFSKLSELDAGFFDRYYVFGKCKAHALLICAYSVCRFFCV